MERRGRIRKPRDLSKYKVSDEEYLRRIEDLSLKIDHYKSIYEGHELDLNFRNKVRTFIYEKLDLAKSNNKSDDIETFKKERQEFDAMIEAKKIEQQKEWFVQDIVRFYKDPVTGKVSYLVKWFGCELNEDPSSDCWQPASSFKKGSMDLFIEFLHKHWAFYVADPEHFVPDPAMRKKIYPPGGNPRPEPISPTPLPIYDPTPRYDIMPDGPIFDEAPIIEEQRIPEQVTIKLVNHQPWFTPFLEMPNLPDQYREMLLNFQQQSQQLEEQMNRWKTGKEEAERRQEQQKKDREARMRHLAHHMTAHRQQVYERELIAFQEDQAFYDHMEYITMHIPIKEK